MAPSGPAGFEANSQEVDPGINTTDWSAGAAAVGQGIGATCVTASAGNNVTIDLPSEALFWVGDVIEDEDGKAYRVVSRNGTTVELDEAYTGPANGKLKLGCGLQDNIGLAS